MRIAARCWPIESPKGIFVATKRPPGGIWLDSEPADPLGLAWMAATSNA
jgi:hypothetical protein